jgi:predicted metal-dependent peptidase
MEGVVSERISKKIYDSWFLTEPALHGVLCGHELAENPRMPLAVRCGRGRIEYNPAIVKTLDDKELNEVFRAEVIRIMLKHPYQRQPDCPAAVRTIASNIVLTNNYVFNQLQLDKAKDFHLPTSEYFEWYAAKLMSSADMSDSPSQQSDSQLNNQSDSQSDGQSNDQSDSQSSNQSDDSSDSKSDSQNQSDTQSDNQPDDGEPTDNQAESTSQQSPKAAQSELWEENEFECSRINEIIENTTSWGSLPGDLVEIIKASLKAVIDYRKVLSGFRASVISSRRNLTRMRPNRRTDFQNLGSVYKMRTNLLVAVDVSGSISSKMLQKFYSVINRFFKYGIESIDTVQFDTQLGEIVPLKKAKSDIKVIGRGGTDFQPVFDFFAESKAHYDGIIIFTDGYAPEPVINGRRPKVLWVFPDKGCEKSNAEMLRKYGRCCVIEC